MKYLSLFLLSLLIFVSGCQDIQNYFDSPAGKITEQDALAQNYDLTTPYYGIQVAISDNVQASNERILNLLDSRIEDFLNCQFFEGSDLGFSDYKLSNGMTVPPLSNLRIYVVRKTFECNAVDKNICGGIYFFDSDTMVVAERSIGRCEDLPLVKHETAHRYGLNADHSNQDSFSFCSDPKDCGFNDFLDLGIGG